MIVGEEKFVERLIEENAKDVVFSTWKIPKEVYIKMYENIATQLFGDMKRYASFCVLVDAGKWETFQEKLSALVSLYRFTLQEVEMETDTINPRLRSIVENLKELERLVGEK